MRTSGCEKKHVTVVLAIAVNGGILPLMIIFKRNTDHAIKYLSIPESFCVVTLEKAWMDATLVNVCCQKRWLAYVYPKAKEMNFSKSFMVMGAFKAHFTDGVKAAMLVDDTGSIQVPAG